MSETAGLIEAALPGAVVDEIEHRGELTLEIDAAKLRDVAAYIKAPPLAFAIVEGLAAGAMLTVITQTMMPEALNRSGGFVGLAALAGFLLTTLVGT